MLGSTKLRRDDREVNGFLAGPKRVGLLAYLVLARPRGFRRRDKVLPLFWRDRGQKAARNALSNMLYHIRRTLGQEVIVNRGAEEIGVDTNRLWSDVIAFEEALDREDAREALDLYQGDLLEGFHLPGAAPAFSQWLDQERERLRTRAAEGSWRLADDAEQAGDPTAARAWARKAAGFTPFSDEAQMRLIKLLDRVGDRAGALRAYEAFAARLRQEWEIGPSEELNALAGEIRARSHATIVQTTPDREGHPSARSIAVLPFETLGRQEPNPFTEGIHGDVLTRLSNVSDLQVISRTSVRRYRNTEKAIPEIGRELEARWVLEGEVQEAAGQFQINTRLINVREDRQVWARDYRGSLTAENVFEIQGDITKKIVRALEAELTPEEEKRVEQQPTESLEAYRLYVQGRGHLDERTEEGIRRGLDYFQQAIEQDASYALAWTGLTDALSLLEFYGLAPPDDAPEPMRAAERAVELDPNLGEAHAALGILHSIRLNGPAARRELNRAVELTPSYAEAYGWLGWVHLCLGRPTEALGPAQQAVALSPLAPAYRVYLAEIYLANGEDGDALREARRAREIQPEYGLAHFMEGLVLHHRQQLAKATSALRKALPLIPPQGTPTHAEVRAALAVTHAASGDPTQARKLLDQIDETGDSFSAGLVHAALGEDDAAFDAFEQVRDWSSFSTEHVRYFFPDVLGPLREDPRYEELLRQVDRSWGLETNRSV